MICFHVGKTEICLEFMFFAAATLFMTLDGTGTAALGIAACFLHEGAHIAVMLLRGKRPEKIRLYGGGIKAVSVGCCNDYSVLAAGCAANFAVFAAVYAFCKEGAAASFAVANLLVGVINLLPVGSLDGGRLLEGIVLRAFAPERAAVILYAVEAAVFVLLLAAAALLLLSGYISPWAAAVLAASALAENFG